MHFARSKLKTNKKMSLECRFCGKKQRKSRDLVELFVSTDDKFSKLLVKIENYLQIHIKNEEILPDKVCRTCMKKANETIRFLQMVEDTQKSFGGNSSNANEGDEESLLERIGERLTPPETPISDNKKAPSENVSNEVSEILKRLQAKDLIISKTKVNKPTEFIDIPTSPSEDNVQELNAPENTSVHMTRAKSKSSRSQSDEDDFDGFDNEDYIPNEDEGSVSSDTTFASDDDDDDDYEGKSAAKGSKRKPEVRSNRTKSRYTGQQKGSKTGEKEKVVVVKLTADPVYICMRCRGKFESFEILKDHMKNSHDCKVAKLVCDVCGKVFEKKKSLYQHTLIHKQKESFVCDQCGKVYSNRFNLENHKSSQHGEYVEEHGCIYKCRICDMQFSNRTDLYAHMDEHSKTPVTLLCDTCGKCFRSVKRLRAHTRLHLNIRPFHCTYCPKHFRSRLQLIQHVHVHTGIKSFACTVCSKAFAKKESLVSHSRRLHTGEMPYECPTCFERFMSINKLKTHRKQHLDAHESECNEKLEQDSQLYALDEKGPTESKRDPALPSMSYVTYVSDYITTSNVLVMTNKRRKSSESERNDNIRLIQL